MCLWVVLHHQNWPLFSDLGKPENWIVKRGKKLTAHRDWPTTHQCQVGMLWVWFGGPSQSRNGNCFMPKGFLPFRLPPQVPKIPPPLTLVKVPVQILGTSGREGKKNHSVVFFEYSLVLAHVSPSVTGRKKLNFSTKFGFFFAGSWTTPCPPAPASTSPRPRSWWAAARPAGGRRRAGETPGRPSPGEEVCHFPNFVDIFQPLHSKRKASTCLLWECKKDHLFCPKMIGLWTHCVHSAHTMIRFGHFASALRSAYFTIGIQKKAP